MNSDDLQCGHCDYEVWRNYLSDDRSVVTLLHDETCPAWTGKLGQCVKDRVKMSARTAYTDLETGVTSHIPNTFRP